MESAQSEDSRNLVGALSATLDTKLQVLDAALADLQREMQTCHLDAYRLGFLKGRLCMFGRQAPGRLKGRFADVFFGF